MLDNYQYILDDNGLNWTISSVIHTLSKEILICRFVKNDVANDRIVIYDIESGKIDYIGLLLGYTFAWVIGIVRGSIPLHALHLVQGETILRGLFIW